jgi:hypothetical protein
MNIATRMNAIIDFFRSLFMSANDRDRSNFDRLQGNLIAVFTATEPLRNKFHATQQKEVAYTTAVEKFRSENEPLLGNGWFTEDHMDPKKLRWVKTFVVVLEAILSLNAAGYFFNVLVGFNIADKPMLVRLVASILFAWLVLHISILLRNIGMARISAGKRDPFSYAGFLLPILVIPCITFYIVSKSDHGDGIWIVLALFTLALNLLVAFWSGTFQEARKSAAAKAQAAILDARLLGARKTLDAIREEVSAVRSRIAVMVTELRALYVRMCANNNAPPILIPLPYLHVVHRHFTYQDVFPLPKDARLTLAPPGLDGFSNFWEQVTAATPLTDTVGANGIGARDLDAGAVGIIDDALAQRSEANEDVDTPSTDEPPAAPTGPLDNDTIPPGDKVL